MKKEEILVNKITFESKEEILKHYSCGNCWIENFDDTHVEFGCEDCENDTKSFQFTTIEKIPLSTDKEQPNCPYVVREGESCRLNNNCTYPNCPINKEQPKYLVMHSNYPIAFCSNKKKFLEEEMPDDEERELTEFIPIKLGNID